MTIKAEIGNSYSDRSLLNPSLGGKLVLQPQEATAMLQRVDREWQRLAAQAERINQLSGELETAIFELKAIANKVNSAQRTLLATQAPLSSPCEYLAAVVPYVSYQSNSSFVLTTRTVDLFQAEREAALVAQALRHLTKRKQLRSVG